MFSPDPDYFPSRIPDPGGQKNYKSIGSRIRNTVPLYALYDPSYVKGWIPRGKERRNDPISRCTRARICRSCKETRYRFSAWRAGTKPYFSYWPARLHRLTKSIPRYRFLGSINVYKYGLWMQTLGTEWAKKVDWLISRGLGGRGGGGGRNEPHLAVATGLSCTQEWNGN